MTMLKIFCRTANETPLPDFAKEATDPFDFLQRAVAFHIQDYTGKRNHNRRYAFTVKMWSAAIAALTTIILGLGSSALFTGTSAFLGGALVPFFSVVALVLSASVTVLSAWEAFAGHDWKWIRYRTTLADLYELKDDLAMSKLQTTPAPHDEIDRFYQRLKQIIHETNTEWSRRRAPTDPPPQAANSGSVPPPSPRQHVKSN